MIQKRQMFTSQLKNARNWEVQLIYSDLGMCKIKGMQGSIVTRNNNDN